MTKPKKIGVLGGLGPLASAKFVETIYALGMKNVKREQDLPIVFLYSDPTMPDRTNYLLRGKENVLLQCLCNGVNKLIKHGVEKIIICCFTLHYLLPKIPEELQSYIISLPALLIEEVVKKAQPVLLLCTKGTRKLKIFEVQKKWLEASDYVVQISKEDEIAIHKIIYEIKKYGVNNNVYDYVLSMMNKYKTQMWAAGCTEFHLLSTKLYHDCAAIRDKIIDPLFTIAEKLIPVSLKKIHV